MENDKKAIFTKVIQTRRYGAKYQAYVEEIKINKESLQNILKENGYKKLKYLTIRIKKDNDIELNSTSNIIHDIETEDDCLWINLLSGDISLYYCNITEIVLCQGEIEIKSDNYTLNFLISK
jgi:hypothetical protein